MKKSLIAVQLVLTAVFSTATPAYAGQFQQSSRDCIQYLVGIKSKTSGFTDHYAYHLGTYWVDGWANGSNYLVRSSVSNHTHLYDSYGFGSLVTFSGGWSWYPYNYCTVYQ